MNSSIPFFGAGARLIDLPCIDASVHALEALQNGNALAHSAKSSTSVEDVPSATVTGDLFAARISPPEDPRGEHELFSNFREALIQRYGATPSWKLTVVDGIASDQVHVTRWRRILESRWRPAIAFVSPDTEKAMRDVKMLSRLIRACEQGRLNCTVEEADLVASWLDREVCYALDAAEDAKDNAEFDVGLIRSCLPSNNQQYAEAHEELRLLDPIRDLLHDPVQARAALRGERPLSPAQLGLIKKLLEGRLGGARQRQKEADEALVRFQQAAIMAETACATDPEKLRRIHRLIAELEREIDRRTQLLERDRAPIPELPSARAVGILARVRKVDCLVPNRE
ncbi:MAG TPA: hypothetical protein VK797_05730 [Tepidisphaeraceae bacterium]|nr:hypothetical protein [Tepidisphaeraceae bacterium]